MTFVRAAALCLLSTASCGEEAPPARRTNTAPTSTSSIDIPLARFVTMVGPLIMPSAVTERRALVTLPRNGNAPFVVEDAASHLAVAAALENAVGVPLVEERGLALATDALGPGNHVLFRPHEHGVEDYLLFSSRPDDEHVRYRVDVSRAHAAGLRFVERTLEFVDATGTPRLRMSPPYLVDARGERHEIDVAVSGCAFDRDPRPPWGRSITAPGASSCAIDLRWDARHAEYPLVVDPAWTATKGVMADKRGYAALVRLSNGLMLVTAGQDGGPAYTWLTSAELFDPATETWAATGSMPAGISSGAAIAPLANGRALVTGSAAGSASVYDVASGTFKAIPFSPANTNLYPSATPLPDGRVLVVVGGSSQIFDPATDTFVSPMLLSVVRQAHCAAPLGNGNVMVAGGFSPSATYSSVEVFDPKSLAWSTAYPPMAYRRSGASCTPLLNGGIVVASGANSSGEESTAEVYDPTTNTWSLAHFSTARSIHAAAALPDGRVLFSGGSSGNIERSTDIYDPASKKMLAGSDMTTPRWYHGAAQLPSGAVLVVGGFSATETLATSEIFRELQGGAACLVDADCTSAHCVDGVCCDGGCKAACYACSVAKKRGGVDGVCEPVAAGPEPSGRCPVTAESSCATSGLCNGAGACDVYPKGTVCEPLTCKSATLSRSTCDGEGACVPETTTCGGFVCASALACGSGPCTGDSDCADGFSCESGACVPVKPTCDGDHTLVAHDGTRTDCSPYKCDGTRCIARCGTSLSCSGENVCDRNGVCIRREDAARATADAFFGGCSSGTPPSSRSSTSSAAGFVALVLACAGGLRRKRSAS